MGVLLVDEGSENKRRQTINPMVVDGAAVEKIEIDRLDASLCNGQHQAFHRSCPPP